MLRGRRSRHEGVEVTKFGAVNCSQLSIRSICKCKDASLSKHQDEYNFQNLHQPSRAQNVGSSPSAATPLCRPHLRPPHCGRRGAALLACPVGKCGSPIGKGLIHIGWAGA